MSKLKNAVIARGRTIFSNVMCQWKLACHPEPVEGRERLLSTPKLFAKEGNGRVMSLGLAGCSHDVSPTQRFVHFTSYLRGLLQAIEVYFKNQHPVGFRNDGLVVRLLFVSYFIFHLSYLAPAQTAYTGGPGDGHAVGELQLRTVGSGEISASQGYQVYPTIIKAGEAVYITSHSAGEFTIVDVSGRVIYTQGFSGPVQPIHVAVTQSGLYLGIIRTAEGTFFQKIIVLE